MPSQSTYVAVLTKGALLLVFYVTVTGASKSWSYRHGGGAESPGPEQWRENFPTCAGVYQSPIILHRPTVVDLPSFEGYLIDETLVLRDVPLTNNGHSVELKLPQRTYELRGGGLPSAYYAAAIHLHWGASSRHGSEHVVEHQHYAMEMHIVHYKSSYQDLKAAMAAKDDPSALAVTGFLFQIGRESNVNFAPISNGVRALWVEKPKENSSPSVLLPRLHLGSLIHKAVRSGFFRYNGSLTTPPCTQDVLWTVFRRPLVISEAQVRPFRRLSSGHGDPLIHNIRPTQPKGNRNLFYSPPSFS